MTCRSRDTALHNRHAERALLGCMLRDSRALAEVRALVSAEDFTSDAHQRVYRAVLALAAEGGPADAVTVADWLHAQGWIPDVGYPLLAELLEAAPTAGAARHYAAIVRDRALRRRLLAEAVAVAQAAEQDGRPVAEVAAEGARRLAEIAAAAGGLGRG